MVDRVQDAVLGGMGLLVLHSGHYSKILRRLLGTSCSLRWRNAGERELVWTVAPAHPIARGVPHPIVIEAQEMYGEHFDIPEPDELVFVSSFAGGEVFRGGCCFTRGRGRIFYFSPGDQEYPVYHHPDVRRVLANAVGWAAPAGAVTVARRARRSRRPAGSSGELHDDQRDRAAARRGRRRGRPRSALGLRAARLRRRRVRRLGRPRPRARRARPRRRSAPARWRSARTSARCSTPSSRTSSSTSARRRPITRSRRRRWSAASTS